MTEPGAGRLAEVLGALSLTTDLADGFRPEQAVRATVVAVGLARAMGIEGPALADVYWTAILRFLGCTGFATEEGFYGAGDDIGLRRTMGGLDGGNPSASLPAVVRGVGAGRPLVPRARGLVGMLAPGVAGRHHAAQCDAGQHLARRLGVGDGVVGALGEVFARWDGAGFPAGLGGDDLCLPVRVVTVAEQAALHLDRGGHEAARGVVQARAGGWFDPEVANAALGAWDEVVGPLDDDSGAWDRYLDAEPEPHARLGAAALDRACDAFGRYADLKSAWRLGHSPGVAELAAAAGAAAGLDDEACTRLRRAALVHDIGVVAVPNLVWDKPGRLGPAELEQVRLHAYWTERVLARTPLLAELAAVAGAAHERPDASGYPKGLPGAALAQEARILAAADTFRAMSEARPHRPALAPAAAAEQLAQDGGAGRHDLAAVRAVLDAAGESGPRVRPTHPAGLSEREVEVLRLVARGASNKEVGRALGITAKTAAHHVAHIYTKVGCQSRAGAALFAVDHGLL